MAPLSAAATTPSGFPPGLIGGIMGDGKCPTDQARGRAEVRQLKVRYSASRPRGAVAGSRARSSISRGVDGFRKPAGHDRVRVRDLDAELCGRPHAIRRHRHPASAGKQFAFGCWRINDGRNLDRRESDWP
jgi:hypothetical protein